MHRLPSIVSWDSHYSTTTLFFPTGNNGAFQLGTGDQQNAVLPTVINDGGASTYQAVSCGGTHTCALRSDGRMLCFGNNEYGACGQGTEQSNVRTPTVVAGDWSFKRIAAGVYHTCALRASDGRAMCFGECGFGIAWN